MDIFGGFKKDIEDWDKAGCSAVKSTADYGARKRPKN